MTEKTVDTRSLPERLAHYLMLEAKHAMVGARLRANGRADESWTAQENEEWEAATDELETAYYALSSEERDFVGAASLILGALCRGEVPGQSPKPTDPFHDLVYSVVLGSWANADDLFAKLSTKVDEKDHAELRATIQKRVEEHNDSLE